MDIYLNGSINQHSPKDEIAAYAEYYSFNIESELFQQLTKEQQALWRKDIEQAVKAGGATGFNMIDYVSKYTSKKQQQPVGSFIKVTEKTEWKEIIDFINAEIHDNVPLYIITKKKL